MSTQTQLASSPRLSEGDFQTVGVLTIVGGHAIHDIFPAFLATLLPLIIEKLSISLTLAGLLSGFSMIPGLLTPVVGHLADRIDMRSFVILAPALTGTLFSLIGLAPSYPLLAALLLVAGISNSIYHAPAPALVGHISGRRIGRGLSLFMAGGEIGRTLGPILIAWAVSHWTLDGTWRMMFLGWSTSAVMFWRLRRVSGQVTAQRGSVRAILPHLGRLFLPMAWLVFFREFVVASLLSFLPTYMNERGASLLLAGASLSIWQSAGVVGALFSGTLSDRLGRKPMLLATSIGAALMTLLFVNVRGWLVIPVLVLSGLTAMASSPVIQAMVQEQLPRNRAMANGFYVMLVFLSRPMIALINGVVGDQMSLQVAFLGSAVISLAAIPAILLLPERVVGD